jgi:hypothetical protein
VPLFKLLTNPALLNAAVRVLVLIALFVGPHVVDLTDRVSVWRFRRARELRRKAAQLRRDSRNHWRGT